MPDLVVEGLHNPDRGVGADAVKFYGMAARRLDREVVEARLLFLVGQTVSDLYKVEMLWWRTA